MEKKRSDPTVKIKCKACVAEADEKEREAAAAKAKASGGAGGAGGGGGGGELLECSACNVKKPQTEFSKGQRNKGPGKQRCVTCVTAKEKALLEGAAGKCRSSPKHETLRCSTRPPLFALDGR